jgi:hypothetical protein
MTAAQCRASSRCVKCTSRGAQPQAMLHHVYDAQLNGRLGEDGLNCLREALNPIDVGNEEILHAPVTQLWSQNFAPSVCASHIPSTSFSPARVTPMAR